MPSFNRVMLIGNLTRDPQSKTLPSNTTVCEFGLAMSRRYRTQSGEDREEVAFVDCSAFGKQAEVIQQYCAKGKQLFVEGRLKYDTWDDKNGGGKRSKLSVVVENFQFLGAPTGSSASHAGPDNVQQPWSSNDRGPVRGWTRERPAKQAEMSFDEKAKFQEADIPF
jgi:single-strand DNA-binding protein